ncbi:MAG: carbon monoxide dehydrogenase [Oscillospiraceae bacterium]
MELYNGIIKEVKASLIAQGPKTWAFDKYAAWHDLGHSELVLTRDAAFELGGGSNPAANFTCVTTDPDLVPENSVSLVGPDLSAIRGDTPFVRIVMLHVNSIGDDDQEAFKTIRDMEFVKYHVFPEGYMMRVSPENQREQVRVSKQAVKKGISFKAVGDDFIAKYLENGRIDHVSITFVVGDMALCKGLEATAKKVDTLTMTLNHIMDGLSTDCTSCSFKQVCDEVEGLKELHFKKGEGPMDLGK